MNPQQLLEQPYFTSATTSTVTGPSLASTTTSMIDSQQQHQHFVVTQQAYHQLQNQQPYPTIDFYYETPHIQPSMTKSSDLSNYTNTTPSNYQIPVVS